MAERRCIGWPKQNCLSTLGGLPIYTTLASKMQIWPPNMYNSTHIYPTLASKYMQLLPPNIYNSTRLISGLQISKPTLPPYLYNAMAACDAMYRVTKQILKLFFV